MNTLREAERIRKIQKSASEQVHQDIMSWQTKTKVQVLPVFKERVMKTWFTSDHHFGHANIIKYCNRPFIHTHEMNLAMEAAWNRVVEPGDLVYYVGDFAMNTRLVPMIAQRLNGRKILIPGNHDKCWRKKDTTGRWHTYYRDAGFEAVEQEIRMDIAGESVLLNHLPYRNESDPEQKYFEYRPVDKGGWLIHGHVHHRWKVSGKQINVSVEVWNFEPVSLTTIAEIIRQGPVATSKSDNLSEASDGY